MAERGRGRRCATGRAPWTPPSGRSSATSRRRCGRGRSPTCCSACSNGRSRTFARSRPPASASATRPCPSPTRFSSTDGVALLPVPAGGTVRLAGLGDALRGGAGRLHILRPRRPRRRIGGALRHGANDLPLDARLLRTVERTILDALGDPLPPRWQPTVTGCADRRSCSRPGSCCTVRQKSGRKGHVVVRAVAASREGEAARPRGADRGRQVRLDVSFAGAAHPRHPPRRGGRPSPPRAMDSLRRVAGPTSASAPPPSSRRPAMARPA